MLLFAEEFLYKEKLEVKEKKYLITSEEYLNYVTGYICCFLLTCTGKNTNVYISMQELIRKSEVMVMPEREFAGTVWLRPFSVREVSDSRL
jgi:hypothetical protein